ncbi:MAG: type II secretion system secretin GspD [Candidatus Scalindua rubra]|uniref:Secretion pathway protein n=1 Tax=Candidatus Scalindua brodae TaxID=237368 RepID=A0A0B0EMC5_9BACT|nr:MAG: secretion pathway protein [Candidatus Scalindua brodae]MBZ0108652.1 type II secretion system secretin GspD [Candidatus Scalindua rubra]TWU37985.1 putative type II secretion system protein D precursor [Candidatus Brocadiaceae bacterium S225]
MTRNILLILLLLMLSIEVGCKMLPGKNKEGKKIATVEGKDKTDESVSRQWEWEISPPGKIDMEEEEKSVPREISYPQKTVEAGTIYEELPEGKKIDITFNFQNADIKEVLKVILGDIMGLNYTIDKRVTGVITLRTEGKFYNNELMDIVQATLNINGFAIVNDGNIFQVLPIQEARGEARIVQLDSNVKPGSREVITQLVPLKHVSPQAIIPTLRGLLTKAGFVIAPNDTHAIVISDNVTNMDRLLKVIDTYDVPFFAGKAMRFYEIKYADPVTLSKDLELVAQTLGASTKAPAMDISFIPFQDTNKILVATSIPKLLDSVESWISNIDIHVGVNKPKMYIYKMQHEQAETTVAILTEMFKEKITPPAKDLKAEAEPMKIIADKNTNSVIIKALASDYQSIKAIIQTIDATPQQVLIEAIVAEVTLTNSLDLGVEVFFRYGGPSASGKPKGAVGSLLPSTEGLVSGDTGTLPGGIKAFTFNRDIDAIFSMVASQGETEILSTPHLLVRDEQTASIQVGSSEPVQSGSTTGSGGVTTAQIEYRDIGKILTITPRIGENNLITLDVSQEISEIRTTNVTVPNTPAFTIRKTVTSLVVKSGHAIYLGGIIDIKDELTEKKIPLLSSIPYIGNIFKSTDLSKTKTELMILITPFIINSDDDADRLSNEFRDKLHAITKMQKKDR